MGFIAKLYAWLVGWQTPPTATEQINAVRSTFDSIVGKLNAAIDQAQSEAEASFERQDAAWGAFLSTRNQEERVRERILAAEKRATIARDRIAALTDGA